jgi:hypothetical protein
MRWRASNDGGAPFNCVITIFYLIICIVGLAIIGSLSLLLGYMFLYRPLQLTLSLIGLFGMGMLLPHVARLLSAASTRCRCLALCIERCRPICGGRCGRWFTAAGHPKRKMTTFDDNDSSSTLRSPSPARGGGMLDDQRDHLDVSVTVGRSPSSAASGRVSPYLERMQQATPTNLVNNNNGNNNEHYYYDDDENQYHQQHQHRHHHHLQEDNNTDSPILADDLPQLGNVHMPSASPANGNSSMRRTRSAASLLQPHVRITESTSSEQLVDQSDAR